MNNRVLFLINVCIIIALLVLPYYIFEGKLFVGGDDTRLFYSFPYEYLTTSSFFSWSNFSSVGTNLAAQYMLPFLSIWSVINLVISDKIVLSYFGFSLPLIIGFIYFKKFISELFELDKAHDFEILTGSLFYILSPILIFDQLFIFLTPVWLIAVFPAVGFYYVRFLRTYTFRYLYFGMLTCLLFSFCLIAIPWILGLLLPISLALLIYIPFSSKSQILIFFKKTFLFIGAITVSQSFWLVGFLAPYFNMDKSSFGFNVLAMSYTDSFSPTVLSTATGIVLYPLLNLFHRQIAFDFSWKLKDEFIRTYDHTFILNSIFIFILFSGLLFFKKYLNSTNRKKFLFVFAAFVLSLYFFTVNIGYFKEIFLNFGKIPGFVMFRNFYDKFAPGYIFIFSLLFTISLVITRKRFSAKGFWVVLLTVFVVILNFSTVKSTVNAPLWTTVDIYKTISLPNEYIQFAEKIKKNISSTNTILSVPFGVSVYTTIKDVSEESVYLGVSPLKIFSGVGDISGEMSFNFSEDGPLMSKNILTRNYQGIQNMLFERNINYIMVTNNIPDQVLSSYGYNREIVNRQDKEFLSTLSLKKILTSKKGNYELYSVKKKNSLLESRNLYFQKISSVKYKLYIEGLKKNQKLSFNDTYHSLWRIYLERRPSMQFCASKLPKVLSTAECKEKLNYFELSDFLYLFNPFIPQRFHSPKNNRTNEWVIDAEYIKRNFSSDYYSQNRDGSIDVQLTLYFYPQLYFYIGTIISLIFCLIMTVLFVKKGNGKNV